MKDLHRSHKKTKAFSLIEVIVSLVIMSICTIAMINFLILSLRITAISLGRSLVREEISLVMNKIARDFRASDISPNCSSNGEFCEMFINGTKSRWSLCLDGNSICKDVFDIASNEYVNQFSTSGNAQINYFRFEQGFSNNDVAGAPNVILTISAGHSNQSLGIDNIVKQASFSIRNYVL